MNTNEQFEKDLETLKIEIIDKCKITKRFVTAKYKRLAKITHPDKPGGVKELFQELLDAYRRVIKYLEEENMTLKQTLKQSFSRDTIS